MTTNNRVSKHPSRSPSPRGCNVPLMTHLKPAERAQLEKLAASDSRSLSAMARVLIVQGMQRLQAQA